MPKINAAGVPSYAGHEGTVTNAVGEQFELNPEDADKGRTVEPIGEGPEETTPVGDVHPITEDAQPVDEPKRDADRRDDASSLDLRDQKQDGKAGAAVPAKTGSPSVKQQSSTTKK